MEETYKTSFSEAGEVYMSSMSKKLTSFIEENHNNIILCGESCVGKSHFADHHNLGHVVHDNMAESLVNIELTDILTRFDKKTKYIVTDDPNPNALSTNHQEGAAGFADLVCNRALESCKIKNAKDRKMIVLGIPYLIWRERVKERRRKCSSRSIPHLDYVAKFTIDIFKENYVKYIRHLIKCKSLLPVKPVPYIFVDNRNDYPILDESKFLTMLTEEN